MPVQYRIVLADDHQIVRDGLRMALETPGMISSLIDSGVNGLFSKGESLDELYQNLAVILRGGSYIATSMVSLIDSQQQLLLLTERERQTLNMIVAGKTNKEIAEHMSVSVKTVDKHRTSLMRKLGVHSVTELMVSALRQGLIDPAQLL